MLIAFQLITGIALLYFGAEWLVNGGVGVAKRFKISPLIIGLTLVAFATSAPEFTVSMMASFKGQGDIAIGNVVGSNICNIGLILGTSTLIAPLMVNRQVLRVDMIVMLLSLIALALLGYFFNGMGRIAGGVLLGFFLIYLFMSIKKGLKGDGNAEEIDEVSEVKERSMPICILLILAGIAGLVIGSSQMVSGAVAIGRLCGMSEAVIALTIVAIGTSLPELATSVVAAVKKESDISIGNVVGSNIFNTLLIMGLVPVIKPIKIVGVVGIDWLVMVGISILLLIFMRIGYRLSRLNGAGLLAVYVVYLGNLVYRTIV